MFGTELHRRRIDAGLSLADLARLVHYSKSHLSKVETGVKPASVELARQCDAALSAKGGLSVLVAPGPGGSLATPIAGAYRWAAHDRPYARQAAESSSWSSSCFVDSIGSAAVTGECENPLDSPMDALPDELREPALRAFRAIFDGLRKLGQWTAPGPLASTVLAQARSVGGLAEKLGLNARRDALVLASRFIEYAGWLAQEAGQDSRALALTDHAVGLAEAGGDHDMRAYAFVRHGLVTLYQGEPYRTVDLARAAYDASTNRRIRGLAAEREAQGHALAGDYDASMRAVERAEHNLELGLVGEAPVIGTSHVTDIASATKGWCLVDLGRPDEAVGILQTVVDRIPATALRARARYGARLALAYASAGEPAAACRAADPVIDAYPHLASATIRADLRRLSRVLGRWETRGAIQSGRLRLTAALHAPQPA